jgi:amino acid transporter
VNTIVGESGAGSTPLQRVIGVRGLGFTAINVIVGSGIFGLPALVAALLGPAAVLAYVVCAVLIGLVGLCFAEAGSRVGGAGGLYAYASVPFGPIVGGIAGTLLWVANGAVTDAAVANLLVDTLATVLPATGHPIPRALILLGLYAIFATINIRGVRSGVRLSEILVVIKLAPLVLLVLIGAFFVHPANLHWASMPPTTAIGQGAVLMFFAFMGVEGALCTSGEVKNPARTVPLAILLALSVVAALYIGLQLVAQGVLGPDLATAKAPLVSTAAAIFGPWGGGLLVAATLLSTTGFLAADILSSPRTLYALAASGQFFKQVAFVHPRFGTPAVAIGTYAVVAASLAVSGSFRLLVLLGSSGTLLLYLICCFGVLRLRALKIETHGAPFRAPGGPFVPLVAVVIILWMLSTLDRIEWIYAGVLVGVAAIVYTLLTLIHRKPA